MTGLSNGFVCIMGMGTVFIGLIAIVFICMIMSAVFKIFGKSETCTEKIPAAPVAPALTKAEKSAVLAGICACIAEELDTDCSNIKVISFKKV